MKRSGLRRDTERARAFAQRGREGSLRRDPDKLKAMQQRAREKALEKARATPAGRGHPVHRPEGRWTKDRVEFRALRPAKSQTCSWRGCTRTAASWHHWTAQQHLRVFARSLRLPDEQERAVLRDLLRDERNLSPFCRKHHGSHGTTSHEFAWSQVPRSAREFARELGDEWFERLRRAYPVTHVRLLNPPERAA